MSDLLARRIEEDTCDELETLVKQLRDVVRNVNSYGQHAFLESCDQLYCMVLETLDRSWEEITKLSEKLRREAHAKSCLAQSGTRDRQTFGERLCVRTLSGA